MKSTSLHLFTVAIASTILSGHYIEHASVPEGAASLVMTCHYFYEAFKQLKRSLN